MKAIKDLSSLSPTAIYKSPLTAEAIKRKLCDEVLTRIILEFCTKKPCSTPSILVNGSEKPNIHSLKKPVLCLIETAEKFNKNTDIKFEAWVVYRLIM